MYDVVFVKVRATCKKKHITYQVSFNSLSGRNWWAHKGRVYGIKVALNYGRSVGIVKPFDRVIIFEKIGDSSVVKIIECEG